MEAGLHSVGLQLVAGLWSEWGWDGSEMKVEWEWDGMCPPPPSDVMVKTKRP